MGFMGGALPLGGQGGCLSLELSRGNSALSVELSQDPIPSLAGVVGGCGTGHSTGMFLADTHRVFPGLP